MKHFFIFTTLSLVTILMTQLMTQFSFADVSWTQQQRPVVHKVTGTETLWFIAQLYYKKGDHYKIIMAANGLKNPNDVKLGAMLMIPNPLYSNHDRNFQARYNLIYKIREDKLNAMNPTPQKTSVEYQAKTELPLKKRSPASEAQVPNTNPIVEDKQNNEQNTDSEHGSVRRLIAE